MRLRFLVAIALAGVAATSCNKGLVDPADNKVETFTGTINPLEGQFNPFTVSRNGELSVRLVSLTPPLPSVLIPTDIRVTALINSQCIFNSQIVADNQSAVPSTTRDAISSTLITAGQFCVWVVDEGFYTQAETYVITVSHP